MLDNRFDYARMVTEDLLRERRELAAIGRSNRRVFHLTPRRPVRLAGSR